PGGTAVRPSGSWGTTQVVAGVGVLGRGVGGGQRREHRLGVGGVEPRDRALREGAVHVALAVGDVAVDPLALHAVLGRAGRVGVPPDQRAVVDLVVVVPRP